MQPRVPPIYNTSNRNCRRVALLVMNKERFVISIGVLLMKSVFLDSHILISAKNISICTEKSCCINFANRVIYAFVGME